MAPLRAPRLSARATTLLGCLLIFAATLFAYRHGIRAGFVWNDSDYVTAPELQSWHGLWRIWFDLGATQQYYPLLHSAFWLEHRAWGDASIGYHLINILLHATSACLFAQILRQLWRPKVAETVRFLSGICADGLAPKRSRVPLPPMPIDLVAETVRFSFADEAALLGGLLFALHPVGVESVAWITEQKNTLSTVLYLLAALGYLRYRDAVQAGRPAGSTWGRYAVGLALFAAAVLSKSVAATLPGALLVILWWRRGRLSWRQDALPLIPWFVVGAAAGLFTGWVEKTYIGAEGNAFTLTPLDRVLVAGRIIWFYLGKVCWPTGLVFIYPRWQVDAGIAWQYLFPVGVLAALAGLTRWAWRSASSDRRAPLAAALLFIGALFPLLGFFNVYAFVFSYVADHWQYLALFGPIALAAGAWQAWRDRWAGWAGGWRLLPIASALAVVGALGVLTAREVGTYRNLDVFYHTLLARNPVCWMAHNNLGNRYYEQKRTAEAKREYEEALRLKPDYPEAHNNLGVILVSEGKIEAAIPHYLEAMRITPGYADAHNNYGIVLGRLGRLDAARAEFETADRLKPDNLQARVNIGNALLAAGRNVEAIVAYEAALRIAPASPDAHHNLGVALQAVGRIPEAVEQYRMTVRLRPELAVAWARLGRALLIIGQRAEAIPALTRALRLDPRLAEAQDALGNCLFSGGRVAAAIGALQEAVRLEPLKPEYHDNLGIALFQAGRKAEAVAQFRESVRLKPGFADANNNLGAVLVDMGQFEEAIPFYRTALRLVPNYPEAHNNLGVALMGRGRLPAAEAEYREALRLKPDLGNAHENLAKVLRKTGRTAEADREAQEAARLMGRPPVPSH